MSKDFTQGLRGLRTVSHMESAGAARQNTTSGGGVSPPTEIQSAVTGAVAAMAADLTCEEGISGIAADAFYSKFHFTREFSRITGTTPRRYLAALRMNRAKELLLESDLSVIDVGTTIGYMSVGTFSTRFSALVGMSPRQWRRSGGAVEPAGPVRGPGPGAVRGTVEFESDPSANSDVFVAAYEDSVLQGPPVASARLSAPGDFELVGLPERPWMISAFVRTCACPKARADSCVDDGDPTVLRCREVVDFGDRSSARLPLHLRPVAQRSIDPPVLYSGIGPDPAMPVMPSGSVDVEPVALRVSGSP